MKTSRAIAIRKSALIYRKEQIDEVNFGAILKAVPHQLPC
jgi:hypothetical protein